MTVSEAADSFLTRTASQLRLSATLEINESVQQRLARGLGIVHLGFGEATFPIQKDVAAAHREASDVTSYLPVAGLMKLRQSIARFQSRRLGSTIKAEQVVVAPGSKPLLFAFFDILDGDILLPRPSWLSYEQQILHAGKRLFWVETDEEDRHTITESSLESTYQQAVADGGSPRIMLINSPSNPTGQAFTSDTVDMIARFCKSHNIILISDEIYSDITFDGERKASPCSGGRLQTGKMILTGGLSKTYSAGGWRIGYAILPETQFGQRLQTAVLAYASECWSAASAPAQEAAAVAFDTRPAMDLYREQVTLLHRRCTSELYKALLGLGLAVAEPKGAFYVYPSFHPFTEQLQARGIKSSAQLSRWLIEECGIATLPGSVFGEDDAGLPGGRYRLRMATSYLYFRSKEERYDQGYDLLASASEGSPIKLPLLDEAICALEKAVSKLKGAV
nr:hypothetical protein [Paramyrothecium roridum]